MNLLEQMRERFPQLSKSQKKIAHYIIENLDIAAFSTAAKIGKATQVSESTVVRFANTMGFEGFPEFSQELAKCVRSRLYRDNSNFGHGVKQDNQHDDNGTLVQRI